MNSLMSDSLMSGDYPNRGPLVFAVTTGTLVLATVFVAARLTCRAFIVRQVSWDDYFIIIAWVLAFGLSFAIDYGTTRGLGRHDADISVHDWDPLRRSEYTFTVLYNPALMAFKTSVLIFYLRLSKNTQKVLRLASWAVLGIVNLAGAVLTLINIFQCSPVQAAFIRGPGRCIPLLTEFICSAPINIVTDLAILALPLPVLTSMRLPQRQKVILIMTFALGVFVTIVDVVRIYYLQTAIDDASSKSSSDPNAAFGGSPQFAWNASLALLWSAVEVNVGIACACIPTLKPLIIRILPAMLIDPDGSTRRTSETADKPPTVQSTYSHELTAIAPNADNELSIPARTHQPESDFEAQISAMEFITTPDMLREGRTHRGRASMLNTATTGSLETSGVYFGFVNLRKPKSLIRMSTRDSLKYCTTVSILFLLWGFSYGLLNTLSTVVAQISNMTVPETLGLTSAYFGAGYFFGPLLVGEWILRRDEHRRLEKRTKNSNFDDSIGGFKATFMLGLCIYGTGTIIFWPSAVLASFPGFLISNFVVGFGLAVLETAANPFIALCGPMDYAEMRLLLSQGVQAVATVISNLLAQKVFFVRLSTSEHIASSTLIEVQWTFLAITLLCVGLALFFYYMPLPEVTDAEMENSTRYLPVDPKKSSFFGFQLRTCTLTLAVLAQWTYVASQETMSIFFRDLLTPMLNAPPRMGPSNIMRSQMQVSGTLDSPGLDATDYLLIAHTAFAVSRFLAAFLAYLSSTHSKVPRPRTILSICAGCSVASGVLVSALRPKNPDLLVIPVMLFFFFEGPIWPLIYALGLRGQGKRTKRAAAFITMGASGPAFWPFVVYAIHQRGASYQTAFAVVPPLLVITGIFPLFLDLKCDARNLVDSRVGPEQQKKIQDSANYEMDLDAILAARRRASVNGLNGFGSSGPDNDKFNFIKKLSDAMSRHRQGSEPSTAYNEGSGSSQLG
ncbi:major facilitator superfamily domain-containing protein [Nemania serpens]|nr:major facilitator superfamily domain-containing protein [Nemania serpens]